MKTPVFVSVEITSMRANGGVEVGLQLHAFLSSAPVAVVDLFPDLVDLAGGLWDWVSPRANLGAVKIRKIFASALFPVRSSGTHFSVTDGLIYPGPNNNNQTSAETILTYLLEHSSS